MPLDQTHKAKNMWHLDVDSLAFFFFDFPFSQIWCKDRYSKMAPELSLNVGTLQALHAARIKDVSVIDALTSIGGLVKNKAGPWVGYITERCFENWPLKLHRFGIHFCHFQRELIGFCRKGAEGEGDQCYKKHCWVFFVNLGFWRLRGCSNNLVAFSGWPFRIHLPFSAVPSFWIISIRCSTPRR